MNTDRKTRRLESRESAFIRVYRRPGSLFQLGRGEVEEAKGRVDTYTLSAQ